MREAAVTGYELWDTVSRNLLDDFDTEVEALDAVRSLIALNGPDCADALALTRVDRIGRMTTLAMGASLVTRAQATRSEQGRLRS